MTRNNNYFSWFLFSLRNPALPKTMHLSMHPIFGAYTQTFLQGFPVPPTPYETQLQILYCSSEFHLLSPPFSFLPFFPVPVLFCKVFFRSLPFLILNVRAPGN